MLRPFPVVGRERQIGEVLALVRRPDMAAAFLVGPAGVGKSSLAAEVLARARGRGHRVVRLAATEACAQVPFAAVAGLLPRRADQPTDRLELFRATREALAAQGRTGRVVVLVDDAHLLDEPSTALLHHLASTGAFLIGTVRGGERLGDALRSLWQHDRAVWISIPPLRHADVIELLRVVLGGQVDRGAAHQLHRRSAGNALYLRELIRAGLESGSLRRADGVWRLHGGPDRTAPLEELLADRLHGVGDEVRAAAEVVAFAEPIGLSLVRQVVPAEALDKAIGHGLVRVVEEGQRRHVCMAHPLIGELLQATTPEIRAAGIHERLSDALARTGLRRRGDALRLGAWQLASGIPGHPRLLLAAAEEAAAVFDHPATRRLARAARDAGAGAPALRLEALATAWLGHPHEAEPLFAELESQATGDGERAWTALLRASNLWLGRGQAERALRVVHDAEVAVDCLDARAMLGGVRAFMLSQTGHTREGLEVCEKVLAAATGPVATAHLLPVRAFALAEAGRTDDARAVAAEAAVRSAALTDRFPYLGDAAGLAEVAALAHAGQLARAAELTSARYDALVDRHRDQARTIWACLGGRLAVRMGRVASAATWLREGNALHRTATTLTGPVGRLDTLGSLALAEVLRGDLGAADATLQTAGTVRREADLQVPSVDLAHAWLLAARGHVEQAHQLLRAIARQAYRRGRLAICLRAVHDLTRLGAPRLAWGWLRVLVRETDGLWPQLYLAHTTALLQQDPVALDQCSARFASAGAGLEAAEAASESAEAYRHRGESTRAAIAGERAHALLARCEGAQLIGPNHASLNTALTTREREIATLAADGLTNRDIAARLSLSVRTIENHLHKVYAKLGLRGRAELSEMKPVSFAGRYSVG